MQVGDLVHCDYGYGIVVAKALKHNGPLYRVVFANSSIWMRQWGLTVIS